MEEFAEVFEGGAFHGEVGDGGDHYFLAVVPVVEGDFDGEGVFEPAEVDEGAFLVFDEFGVDVGVADGGKAGVDFGVVVAVDVEVDVGGGADFSGEGGADEVGVEVEEDGHEFFGGLAHGADLGGHDFFAELGLGELGDVVFDLFVGGVGGVVGEAEEEDGALLGVEVLGFDALDHEARGLEGEALLVDVGGHKDRLERRLAGGWVAGCDERDCSGGGGGEGRGIFEC